MAEKKAEHTQLPRYTWTEPRYFWVEAKTRQHLHFGLPEDHDYQGISCGVGNPATERLITAANYHDRLVTAVRLADSVLSLYVCKHGPRSAEERALELDAKRFLAEAESLLAEMEAQK